MHGVRRVITFCMLTAVLPTTLIVIPLYLRHYVYVDVAFAIADSDVLEVREGISSVFCQQHKLRMNTSFNAYQIVGTPKPSETRKHIRLKKSFTLPDDTLEYWGFFLIENAKVVLKVCSRFEGSRILVVKGERNLETCGLLEHNKKKSGTHFAHGHGQVKVTYAQEIVDHGYLDKPINVEFTKDGVDKENDTGANGEADSFEEIFSLVDKYLKNSTKEPKIKTDTRTDNDSDVAEERIDPATPAGELEFANSNKKHKKRHVQRHLPRKRRSGKRSTKSEDRLNRKLKLEKLLNEEFERSRLRRDLELNSDYLLDRGVEHGGNAANYTKSFESSSVSSFENGLLTCYDGRILLSQGFSPNHKCNDVSFLETEKHMETVHEVLSSGYYYYIFYSDNDFVANDIHAVFDIYKPIYQYANESDGINCINSTECVFNIPFLSDQRVIVEVPTRDGIEHEEDDFTTLVSSCHPRMTIYIIFPIAVLFLILGCAFL